jgi:hypothetical protein
MVDEHTRRGEPPNNQVEALSCVFDTRNRMSLVHFLGLTTFEQLLYQLVQISNPL